MSSPTLSPELKQLLKDWCKMQEEKYGPEWKEILAEELTEEFMTKFYAEKLGEKK